MILYYMMLMWPHHNEIWLLVLEHVIDDFVHKIINHITLNYICSTISTWDTVLWYFISGKSSNFIDLSAICWTHVLIHCSKCHHVTPGIFVNIYSGNGLVLLLHQAITWTSTVIWTIATSEANFSEIWIKMEIIQEYALKIFFLQICRHFLQALMC